MLFFFQEKYTCVICFKKNYTCVILLKRTKLYMCVINNMLRDYSKLKGMIKCSLLFHNLKINKSTLGCYVGRLLDLKKY